MNTGNFVTSILFPSPDEPPAAGIVVRKWVDKERAKIYKRTYQFTIDLLDVTGKILTLDIHADDEWKVIS